MRVWLVAFLLIAVSGCMQDETPAPEPAPTTSPPVDTTERPVGGTAAQDGRWLAPFEGEVPAVSMALLPDGRILYWSGVEAEQASDPSQQVFFTTYPKAGESRILEPTGDGFNISTPINEFGDGDDLFCAGQTMLPDGRIMTAGGSAWHNSVQDADPFLDGSPDARIFDPATDTWTAVSEMELGRWYPSVFTSPTGKAVSASGIGNLATFSEHWANWETYDEREDDWSLMPGTDGHLLPLYPRLHVLPGGEMAGEAFYSAVGTLWGPFGEHPQQEEWSFFKSYDLAHDTWHEHGLGQFGARNYATSVMLPVSPDDGYAPKVVSAGGTLQQSVRATAFAELIDVSGDVPMSTRIADMNHARWNHQGVLMPDGQVLIVGGGEIDNVVLHGQENTPIMVAEVFDPEGNTWTDVAEMSVPRMYHSTAVLLPDARVLVGGHVPLPMPWQETRDTVMPQITETRLEIYEPAYLFRGERPAITAAPVDVGYGDTFTVDIAYNGSIESVMLMRPGTVTHAYDSGQRAVYLEVVDATADQLTLRAPPSGIVTPPGPHMLFVNGATADGPVPSVAAWVQLDDPAIRV